MNHSYPVYTVDAECQDCYKCVRHCPVKAKHVRNDIGRARLLLGEGKPVYASLAPSWVSEFKNITPGQLIRALKDLGFTGVSETALGAQLVSARIADELGKGASGLMLSSACPTAVDFVCKYMPELAGTVTPIGSPLMAHCRYLRDTYGDDIRVIFLGPCIAKKNEADRRPELLNLALTYPELKQLLREAGIQPERLAATPEDRFVPVAAEEGALYPVEGGMLDTIRLRNPDQKVHYATLTGLDNMKTAFTGLDKQELKDAVFVETLACPGGCVHGPCAEHDSPGLLERLRVQRHTHMPEKPAEWKTPGGIDAEFAAGGVAGEKPAAGDLTAALKSIGKNSPEDELNCDGCGYDTCRNFAKALLAGHAEPSMCVSYLKKQAQKKANALIKSIPSGVVIADKNLQVIECNRNFATLMGPETLDAFEACPGLGGADLRRIVSFADLFESSLKSGRDVRRDSLKVGKRLLNVNIFNIDAGETVGGVIFDVTRTELRRSEIAARAREVIDRNLTTVQEIACRLGEQMADTELLLRSIADNYADDAPGDSGAPEQEASS